MFVVIIGVTLELLAWLVAYGRRLRFESIAEQLEQKNSPDDVQFVGVLFVVAATFAGIAGLWALSAPFIAMARPGIKLQDVALGKRGASWGELVSSLATAVLAVLVIVSCLHFIGLLSLAR